VKNEAGDHREDGGVGGNAEGESQNHNESESARFAEETRAETKVLEERFERGKSALISDALFGLLKASELEESGATGFVGSEAGAEIVVDVVLEMGEEFSVQFPFEVRTAKQVKDALEGGAKGVHRWASRIPFVLTMEMERMFHRIARGRFAWPQSLRCAATKTPLFRKNEFSLETRRGG
jgi:hypothetical protein